MKPENHSFPTVISLLDELKKYVHELYSKYDSSNDQAIFEQNLEKSKELLDRLSFSIRMYPLNSVRTKSAQQTNNINWSESKPLWKISIKK